MTDFMYVNIQRRWGEISKGKGGGNGNHSRWQDSDDQKSAQADDKSEGPLPRYTGQST